MYTHAPSASSLGAFILWHCWWGHCPGMSEAMACSYANKWNKLWLTRRLSTSSVLLAPAAAITSRSLAASALKASEACWASRASSNLDCKSCKQTLHVS